MTAGCRCRRSVRRDGHIRTAATEAAETAAGRTASVVARMTAGVSVPPERPVRRTHPDSGDGGRGDGGGKNGLGGGSSPGRDNDLRCRWRAPSPSLSSWGGDCGRDDDDGGRKGGRGDGEATARRRRGDGEAMARRLQDNDEATRMRRQSAMAPQVAGATRQSTSG